MANNIIIKKKYLQAGQPDGYVDGDIVRTRVFRQTATVDGTVNAGDTIGTSDYMAAAKIPQGFIVEGYVVDVVKASSGSPTLSLYLAKNATGIDNESANNYDTSGSGWVTLGTGVAMSTAGQKFGEVLATGTVDSTVATLTTAKSIAGANDYLVLNAGTATIDAEFVVRLFGRWLPPEA